MSHRTAAAAALMSACLICVPSVALAQGVEPSADVPVAAVPVAPAPLDPPVPVEPVSPGRPTPCAPAAESGSHEGSPPAAAPAPPEATVSTKPPEATCAQNAGDQQYEDPFHGVKPPSESGKPQQGGPSQSETQPTQQAAAPATGASAAQSVLGADPADAAPGLPNTGFPAGWLLVAGLALLTAGIVLRRRLRGPASAGARTVA